MQFCHHYHHYSCMPPKCGASICTQYALNHARISLRCVTPKVWNASMLGMQFEFGNLNCAHFGQGKSQGASTSWLPSTCNFPFQKRAPTSKASIENKMTYDNDIFLRCKNLLRSPEITDGFQPFASQC